MAWNCRRVVLRPLSRAREEGTTAHRSVLDAGSLTRVAPVLGLSSAFGAAGSWGPEPGDLAPSTNRSAAQAVPRAGEGAKGVLDIRYHSRRSTSPEGSSGSAFTIKTGPVLLIGPSCGSF